MTIDRKKLIFNILALICSIWFLLLGWYWGWLINVIFVFPFAIVGFIFWRLGRGSTKPKLNRIVGWLLSAGLVTTLGSLLLLTLRN
jgi:hypothetical protein